MEKSKRPSTDQYFMNIAKVVATRATCDRAHVGALLTRDKEILATGYNGSPRGLKHCDEVGHEIENGHCIRTTHAEQNAIVQAALHGVSTKDATLYTTHSPCYICAKMIVNAGIKRVVAGQMYREPQVAKIFKATGVKFEVLNEKE